MRVELSFRLPGIVGRGAARKGNGSLEPTTPEDRFVKSPGIRKRLTQKVVPVLGVGLGAMAVSAGAPLGIAILAPMLLYAGVRTIRPSAGNDCAVAAALASGAFFGAVGFQESGPVGAAIGLVMVTLVGPAYHKTFLPGR